MVIQNYFLTLLVEYSSLLLDQLPIRRILKAAHENFPKMYPELTEIVSSVFPEYFNIELTIAEQEYSIVTAGKTATVSNLEAMLLGWREDESKAIQGNLFIPLNQ
jgi:hypothetical protein